MSAEARANGWRGFDGIGEKVERGEFGHGPEKAGWLYRCDGMPTLRGCPAEIVVTRRYARVGLKSTGWLVCYGQCFPDEQADDKHGHDLDVVLTFCPSCAAVVKEQDASGRRMTREPSHDMWDAALHAALAASHARDGHPNPAQAADHTIATTPRLCHDGDDAAEVIAEDRAFEDAAALARYIERKQP